MLLAYSLSMKPWSQVLTLYLRIFCTTSSKPSFPSPSPSGRDSFSFSTNASGFRVSTRTLLGTPSMFTDVLPPAFCGAASSAALMYGTINPLTASSSYTGQSSAGPSSMRNVLLESSTYIVDFISSTQLLRGSVVTVDPIHDGCQDRMKLAKNLSRS